ncbi:MAG: biotin/lipoyl-containing protein [Enterobacterales bacterium]|nr:biotin/lipoyl-containing protein [Enterobacterales bacterium]
MPGTLIDIAVNVGDKLNQGDSLMVVEAMKMEHQIKAHRDLLVTDVYVAVGDLVDETTQLIEFEEQ